MNNYVFVSDTPRIWFKNRLLKKVESIDSGEETVFNPDLIVVDKNGIPHCFSNNFIALLDSSENDLQINDSDKLGLQWFYYKSPTETDKPIGYVLLTAPNSVVKYIENKHDGIKVVWSILHEKSKITNHYYGDE